MGERPLPAFGPPDDAGDKDGFDVYVFDELDANDAPLPDAPSCCPVTFAIADPDGELDESYVMLVGDEAPLRQGLLLRFSEGTWSVDACVPSDHTGSYSYVFAYEVDGELDEVVTHNPDAPSGNGTDNVWLTADSCEESQVGQHASTSSD